MKEVRNFGAVGTKCLVEVLNQVVCERSRSMVCHKISNFKVFPSPSLWSSYLVGRWGLEWRCNSLTDLNIYIRILIPNTGWLIFEQECFRIMPGEISLIANATPVWLSMWRTCVGSIGERRVSSSGGCWVWDQKFWRQVKIRRKSSKSWPDWVGIIFKKNVIWWSWTNCTVK